VLAIVVHHRPTLWGWVGIVGLLAWSPWSFLVYQSGTPTIWFAAIMALATRWPWVAAFVLVKPTLAPIALLGILDRRWWWVAIGIGLLALASLPLTIDWIRVVLNARGPLAGLGYSFENVPVLLIPLVAWLFSGRVASINWRRRIRTAFGVGPRNRWVIAAGVPHVRRASRWPHVIVRELRIRLVPAG
jgi:hypothetical protein